MAFVGASSFVTRSVRARVCSVSAGNGYGIRRLNAGRAITRMMATAGATTTAVDLAALKDKLMKMFDDCPCEPIMVRLAWHDAGTYDKNEKTPGADASIRFNPEMAHGANNGLAWAVEKLEPLKAEFPGISYADLYQYASVVAIEHGGGPKIPFKTGRIDAKEEHCTPDGRLPDATKRMGHLRDVFYRMGLTDKDIVTLSGAHTYGRAHKDRSGFEGPWTHKPNVFDNAYFVEILKPDGDPDLLRLESDLALLDEPGTRELVELYAKDQDAFFKDYTESHVKLSELGWSL